MLGWEGGRVGRTRVLAENDNNWRKLKTINQFGVNLAPNLDSNFRCQARRDLKFHNTNSKGCGVKIKMKNEKIFGVSRALNMTSCAPKLNIAHNLAQIEKRTYVHACKLWI